jgi:stearoyl-CoA desaturase (Delta-9 desaturase)
LRRARGNRAPAAERDTRLNAARGLLRLQRKKESTNTQTQGYLGKSLVLVGALVPLAGTLIALWLAWQRVFVARDLALLVGLYIPISLGITIGFHRYLTHRGFATSGVIKGILIVLGSMAVQGSAIEWVANHRKHHAFADRSGDPHSPLEGFFHAHIGWLWIGDQADTRVYARDLLEDPMVVLLSRLTPFWIILGLAIPLAIGGWEGFLWGGLVRVFLTHHVTWSVNSVTHTFGRRPFATNDRSTNQWIVGLLALGEGWHNNHHAFPRSAFHGLRWWQFDLSGLVIRLMAALNLIKQVQRVGAAEVRARLARAMTAANAA